MSVHTYVVHRDVDNIAALPDSNVFIPEFIKGVFNKGDTLIDLDHPRGLAGSVLLLRPLFNVYTKSKLLKEDIWVCLWPVTEIPEGFSCLADHAGNMSHIELEIPFELLPCFVNEVALDQDIIKWRLTKGC